MALKSRVQLSTATLGMSRWVAMGSRADLAKTLQPFKISSLPKCIGQAGGEPFKHTSRGGHWVLD